MAYHFLCITRAPKHIIIQKMLPDVEAAVETVCGPDFDGVLDPRTAMLIAYITTPTLQIRAHAESAEKQAQYEGLSGFWDDYCLAHFLHAVCLRYIAHEVIGVFL
jgi:hypothetical protein